MGRILLLFLHGLPFVVHPVDRPFPLEQSMKNPPLAAKTPATSSAYFEVELVVTGCFSRSTDFNVQGPVERET